MSGLTHGVASKTMKELVFSKDLYDGKAVDSACQAFRGVSSIEQLETDGAYVVRIEGTGRHSEAELVGEFCNFALGATIEAARIGGAHAS